MHMSECYTTNVCLRCTTEAFRKKTLAFLMLAHYKNLFLVAFFILSLSFAALSPIPSYPLIRWNGRSLAHSKNCIARLSDSGGDGRKQHIMHSRAVLVLPLFSCAFPFSANVYLFYFSFYIVFAAFFPCVGCRSFIISPLRTSLSYSIIMAAAKEAYRQAKKWTHPYLLHI